MEKTGMKRLLLSLTTVIGCPLVAQQPPDSAKQPPASVSPPERTSLDFSGVLFANFQYRGDKGAKSQNKFDLERAYLTFRMPVGERGALRVTLDVFQHPASATDNSYNGWIIRAKYAYLQWKFLESMGWTGAIRGGLIQNVVIDQVESFWPRWLSQTAIERAGFFSSSDAGVGTLIGFPNKLGEFYATVVNGPGYTAREADRFKDFAARITFTPLSASDNRLMKSFALSAWSYLGAVGSAFAAGGAGQIGEVGSALPRRRSGIFAGIRDPRLSAGAEWAIRRDASESGANTVAQPRVEVDSSGRLLSAFTYFKPFQLVNSASKSPFGMVARWDRFKPNTSQTGYVNTVISGLTFDLNANAAISLDYQEQTPHYGAAVIPSKTYFFHLIANF
jgi:hypothetical protein